MFRFLLSAASIFVLLTSTLLSPGTLAARRCGEKMPVTLLSLYRDSEFIYIGKYDGSEDGESTEETEEYRVIPIKKHYSISSALKGESRKMVTLEDTEYRYTSQETFELEPAENAKDVEIRTDDDTAVTPEESRGEEEAASAAEEETTEEVAEADDTELRPGDSVLLFLKKNEDNGHLDLSDNVDGIKKMTPDKLAAYEPRIRELEDIFSDKKPSYLRIVAWLVRCAEDPETRWEGTYELLQSFTHQDWQEERDKEEAAKPAEAAEPGSEEQPPEYYPRRPKEFDTGDPNFAKTLSEGEKLLLTNILLKREHYPDRSGNSEVERSMPRGDRELIELVRRWGDTKVAANLTGQLRYDSSDPNFATELMESISSILDDGELAGISEKYSSIQWENGDDAVESEVEKEPVKSDGAEETPAVVNDAAEPASSTEIPVTGSTETVSENAAAPAEKNPEKRQTYFDLRLALVQKFLDRADKLIVKKENRETPN